MQTHRADKTNQFSWWLPDVIWEVPGIEQVTYAGVTEVTQWNILKVIYTNGQIKNADGTDTQQFHVAVSNNGDLGSDEMLKQFTQSVTKKLAEAMNTNKSLPST